MLMRTPASFSGCKNAVVTHCGEQSLDAEVCVEGHADIPTQYPSRIPIKDHKEIDKSFMHPHIGGVDCSQLVRSGDFKPA
jgi:hypothetical protein